MTRTVLLSSGAWADLPLGELAPKAAEWGYQGLELCTWADHFEVQRALEENDYTPKKLDLLSRNDLTVPILDVFTVKSAAENQSARSEYSSAERASEMLPRDAGTTVDGQSDVDSEEDRGPPSTAKARPPVPDCVDRNRATRLAAHSGPRGVLLLGLARRHPGRDGVARLPSARVLSTRR